MRKYDLGISVVMVLFSAWIFYATKDFPTYYAGAPGSGFWPRVLAVAGIVLAVVLAVSALWGRGKRSNEDKDTPVFRWGSKRMKRIYFMLAVMILTGFSLKYLGFVITSLWFVPAVMLIMEERRVIWIVLSSFLMTGSVYVIFTWFLKMSLPKPFFM